MAVVRIAVSNYRCFGDSKPAVFELGPGVTAFVGANNAGKSTILRMFWELRGIFTTLGLSSDGLQAGVARFEAFGMQTDDPGQIFHDGNERDLVLDVSFNVAESADPPIDRVQITVPRGTNTFTSRLFARKKPIGDVHHWSDSIPLDQEGQSLGDPGPAVDVFRRLASVRYLGARRSTTSQAGGQDFDGVTGSNLITRWRGIHGGPKTPRARAREIERRLGTLFGFPGLTMTVSENGQELIVGIEDQTYRIDELGSGLGHFAVALMTIAETSSISWLLVDEPENGLHPTMQLELLRTLETGVSDGVVIATHSYGLARMVAAKTYLVRRNRRGRYSELHEPLKAPSLAEFLGEMGYSGYRDLGFDRLLLVEGPFDLRVVDEFRRKIGGSSSVLLLPLGGSDAINRSPDQQLSEIMRLTTQTFALIDSERSSPDAPLAPPRVAFAGACAELGIECHVLERRSLENYLADGAIRAVLGPGNQALGPFDRPGARLKSRQSEVAARMTIEELRGTDLLTFLQRVFKGPHPAATGIARSSGDANATDKERSRRYRAKGHRR